MRWMSSIALQLPSGSSVAVPTMGLVYGVGSAFLVETECFGTLFPPAAAFRECCFSVFLLVTAFRGAFLLRDSVLRACSVADSVFGSIRAGTTAASLSPNLWITPLNLCISAYISVRQRFGSIPLPRQRLWERLLPRTAFLGAVGSSGSSFGSIIPRIGA